MELEGFIKLGKMMNAHGLRGEIKVKPLTTYPAGYFQLEHFFLYHSSRCEKFKIQKLRLVTGNWFIKMLGIEDRDTAERFKTESSYLYIQESELLPLDEDEFFVHDLINAAVYTKGHIFLGKIIRYFETGANGVCEVEAQKGNFLFPTTLSVLQEIIPEEKKVIIDPISGLLDLNL